MNFCSMTAFLPEKYCGYGITRRPGRAAFIVEPAGNADGFAQRFIRLPDNK